MEGAVVVYSISSRRGWCRWLADPWGCWYRAREGPYDLRKIVVIDAKFVIECRSQECRRCLQGDRRTPLSVLGVRVGVVA